MTVRPAKTQTSLGICPVLSEPLLCIQWVAKDTSFLHVDSEDTDQAHMPFCWFCHEAAHIEQRFRQLCNSEQILTVFLLSILKWTERRASFTDRIFSPVCDFVFGFEKMSEVEHPLIP